MSKASPLRIIFAGTPDFSAVALKALLQSHHSVLAVYTQPDRPAGRGRQLTASPVKMLAMEHHLPVHQPITLKDKTAQETLAAFHPDLMVVAAYGLLLPSSVLSIPKLGCLNIHASLLPKWRGAAPIQRAILNGDLESGITIMQMDKGLDTGDMLYKKACSINPDDTSASLQDRLATLGAEALLHTLDHLHELHPEKQNNSQATYAHKIKKEEAKIHWNLPAITLERMVRAFNPWPVAFFGDIRIFKAKAIESKKDAPGTILQATKEGIDIATGEGALRLLKLQLPGGRVLPVVDLLNARKNLFEIGNILL